MAAINKTRAMLFILGAFAFLTLVQAPARAAEDDAALREQALKLNDVTGDEATDAALKDLLKEPANTKKLLAVAAKMAKEKDQPFKVNATIILAKAAHAVRDYDT